MSIDVNTDATFRSLRILATVPEFTEPLARTMLLTVNENVLVNWNFKDFINATIGSTFSDGNGVGGIDDFIAIRDKRLAAHKAFAEQEPDMHQRLHYLLFRISSGYNHRHRHEAMPNYLRTIQGTAYHLAFIDANIALPYYQTILTIAQTVTNGENPFLPSGHLFLTGQLLHELKENFGIFPNEPITDELCTICKRV